VRTPGTNRVNQIDWQQFDLATSCEETNELLNSIVKVKLKHIMPEKTWVNQDLKRHSNSITLKFHQSIK
jgi:hypothetical protein